MRIELRGIRRNTRLVDYVLLSAVLVSVALAVACNPPPPPQQYALTGSTWESVDPLYYHIGTEAGENTQLAFSVSLADWKRGKHPGEFPAECRRFRGYPR